MNPVTAHAITVALEARIRELAKFHNWYVVNKWARGPEWDAMRHDDRTELRALLAVHRTGRRLARAEQAAYLADVDRLFPEQADPITAAKADRDYHRWQAEGPIYGFDNPEGDPTLNGAFR